MLWPVGLTNNLLAEQIARTFDVILMKVTLYSLIEPLLRCLLKNIQQLKRQEITTILIIKLYGNLLKSRFTHFQYKEITSPEIKFSYQRHLNKSTYPATI